MKEFIIFLLILLCLYQWERKLHYKNLYEKLLNLWYSEKHDKKKSKSKEKDNKFNDLVKTYDEKIPNSY